nr:MAG TPA: hypothetical protein [Caudoviricetes sp.]DAM76175.1 MAG TPA: hypothetical protein [Caudoviricetes sp.]
MKTTATPQEILAKTYLNISDIQALLGMTREPARALFKQVKNIETEKLGKFDVWPNMIQKDNLLKALHISREVLLRDLELREANKKALNPSKVRALK